MKNANQIKKKLWEGAKEELLQEVSLTEYREEVCCPKQESQLGEPFRPPLLSAPLHCPEAEELTQPAQIEQNELQMAQGLLNQEPH